VNFFSSSNSNSNAEKYSIRQESYDDDHKDDDRRDDDDDIDYEVNHDNDDNDSYCMTELNQITADT
jgi:hypothetical protein